MAKIIKLSDSDKGGLHQYLDEIILKLQSCSDKISFTKVLIPQEKHRATLTFTPLAWSKMSYILMKNSAEVAWHGLVRKKTTEPFSYEVYDVLIYPQQVSGSTVDTDQVAYQDWTTTLTDAQFEDLRMQAHSHVTMGVTPSGRDEGDQKRLLESMPSSIPFYIFMIWNKSMEYNCRIYDMENNILFETSDVDLKLCDDSGFDSDEFRSEMGKLVVRQVYTPPAQSIQKGIATVSSVPNPNVTAYNNTATYKTTPATATNAVQSPAVTPVKANQKGSTKKKKTTVAALHPCNACDEEVYDYETIYNHYGYRGNGEDPNGPFGWYER